MTLKAHVTAVQASVAYLSETAERHVKDLRASAPSAPQVVRSALVLVTGTTESGTTTHSFAYEGNYLELLGMIETVAESLRANIRSQSKIMLVDPKTLADGSGG